MKSKKLSILFVIKQSKKNKKGLCPINFRVTYDKKRNEFSTSQFVSPQYWNSKKQLVTSKDPNHEFINAQLALIAQKLNNIYLSFQLKGSEFGVSDITDVFHDRIIKKEENVYSYYITFLASLEGLIGKDLKQSTYNKFNYVGNDVKAFIKYKYKVNDVALPHITIQFLNDFEYYLKTVKNQKQITINKSIQRFRKSIKSAVAEGYLEKDPFILYKTKTVKPVVVFLDTEELKLLEETEFAHPKLQLVKNLFIFSCYTGLAYYEISNLESKHIIKGFDGELWIQMNREKTSKPFSVPLLPKALELLKVYQKNKGRVFPNISNQRYNTFLKEISALTGIDKNLTTHTARRTFASTVLLYNDVPMEIVSELLGHSSMKVTQESYGKVVQKKISLEMMKVGKTLKRE